MTLLAYFIIWISISHQLSDGAVVTSFFYMQPTLSAAKKRMKRKKPNQCNAYRQSRLGDLRGPVRDGRGVRSRARYLWGFRIGCLYAQF